MKKTTPKLSTLYRQLVHYPFFLCRVSKKLSSEYNEKEHRKKHTKSTFTDASEKLSSKYNEKEPRKKRTKGKCSDLNYTNSQS